MIARSAGWIGKVEKAEVFTAKAKKVQIIEKVNASGKIQPETEVKISPEVSGEIIEVLIMEGDSVKKGQLLLRLKPDLLQKSVESSQANLNSVRANYSQSQAVYLQRKSELLRSEAEYQRNKKLFDDKVISETDFLTAKTNYEVAKQQLAAAQQSVEAAKFNMQSSQASLSQSVENLSRTEIYAPVTGTVSKLSVEKGEKVVGTAQMAGTEMLIIANLHNMEVQVDVNENDIVKVKIGQKVIIEVDSYSGTNRKFEGIVTEIANTANATASADAVTEFLVKIRILNESYKDLINPKSNLSPFRPGMTASVDIVTNEKKGVLSVPISAVTTRNKEDLNKEEENKKDVKPVSSQNTDDKKTKKVDDVKEYVFVYNPKDEKVYIREVKTGISDFENIEIIKGLKEGEEVVTGPFLLVSKQLKDGQEVKKNTQTGFNKTKSK